MGTKGQLQFYYSVDYVKVEKNLWMIWLIEIQVQIADVSMDKTLAVDRTKFS